MKIFASGRLAVCAAVLGLFVLPVLAQESVAPAPRAGNPHGDINLDCRLCHAEQNRVVDGKVAAFDHGSTGFPLVGRHALVACRDCHKQPQFAHIGTRCADCHLDAHKSQLGPACEQCHTSEGWVDRTRQQREHDTTRLPLVGAHAKVDCDACHAGAVRGEYIGTPYECIACHQAQYDATRDPDHRLAGFITDCNRCHGVFSATWGSGDFIHSLNFPLTGAHAATACASCHQERFAGTPTDCYACHQTQYTATANPPHTAANLGTACVTCHGTAAWSPSTYDHGTPPANYRLEGGHRGVDCRACHTTGFVATPTDCYACHRPDYEGAADPNHVVGGFPTDCTTCHAVTTWTESNFDHARTAFPLTGAHATPTCTQCHATGYTGTPTDCYACHQTQYTATANPPHTAANLGTACVTCHGTAAWSPSTYDHGTPPANYRLEGGHRGVDCRACHTTGFVATPTDCYACHRPDYEGAADPNHVVGGFPTDCTTCHAVTTWTESNFDHARTAFPLTGAHATPTCTQCHATGYTGTPTDCYACHQTQYTATANPNHAVANIPTICVVCHSTTAWTPAQFDHNTTAFPLTGAHRAATCAACHAGGYTGTPNNCYACHQTDYARTSNPSHSAASFPTTCATCHSTTAWTPSSWNHETYFPIASGKHSNFSCTQCHVTSGNYGTFECILCHEHNQSDMASKHQGRPSYQWVSSACYSCHPRGRS